MSKEKNELAKPSNPNLRLGQNIQNESTKHDLSSSLSIVNQAIEKKLTPEIILQIQAHIKSHWAFDFGTEWVIYKIPINIDGKIGYFLVSKKRYDKNISWEYNNHKTISQILDKDLEFKKDIWIPKLYWHFEDAEENESYIIMDYIQGKTLFSKVVDKICWVDTKNDQEAIKILSNFVHEQTGSYWLELEELYNFLKDYIEKHNIKLFSYHKGLKLKHSLKHFFSHIHKNWFYHRDVGNNRRNIIVWDDGKLYVIDFGHSLITNKKWDLDPSELQEIYLQFKKGNEAQFYPRDETILETLRQLTPMPAKREPRELNY